MAQRQFQFRLEALLEMRALVEKEKQRRVAAIQGEIQALVRQIQEANTQIGAENRSLSSRELTGRLDMAYIAHEKKYVGNLQMRIVQAMQKIAVLEKTLAGARAELLEAARAKKVIEKLKEKQRTRWQMEQDRKEAGLMDEIGTQLAVRGNS